MRATSIRYVWTIHKAAAAAPWRETTSVFVDHGGDVIEQRCTVDWLGPEFGRSEDHGPPLASRCVLPVPRSPQGRINHGSAHPKLFRHRLALLFALDNG